MGHLPGGEELLAGGSELPPGDDPGADFSFRAIATSPAVGIYQSRTDVRAGSRVRAGDRLATVDVLGLPQPVLAPADGLVGATLVEHGEAVEYGQELIRIELPEPGVEVVEAAPALAGTGSTSAPASAASDARPAVTSAGPAAGDDGPAATRLGGEA
jgi:predicted deacylase